MEKFSIQTDSNILPVWSWRYSFPSTPLFCLGLLFFLEWVQPSGFGKTELPVEVIVERAIARSEELRKHREQLEYDLMVTTERMDEDLVVIKSSTTHATVRCEQELVYQIDAGEDPNGPVSVEGEKKRRSLRDARRFMGALDLRKLAPRFAISQLPSEELNGRMCYVLQYEPRSDQPYASREEKIVNAMHGRFWIAQEDFSTVRGEGSLSHSVSIAWFLAELHEVRFISESGPLPNGEMGPMRFDLYFNLSASLFSIRQRQRSEMTHYRPLQNLGLDAPSIIESFLFAFLARTHTAL